MSASWQHCSWSPTTAYTCPLHSAWDVPCWGWSVPPVSELQQVHRMMWEQSRLCHNPDSQPLDNCLTGIHQPPASATLPHRDVFSSTAHLGTFAGMELQSIHPGETSTESPGSRAGGMVNLIQRYLWDSKALKASLVLVSILTMNQEN